MWASNRERTHTLAVYLTPRAGTCIGSAQGSFQVEKAHSTRLKSAGSWFQRLAVKKSIIFGAVQRASKFLEAVGRTRSSGCGAPDRSEYQRHLAWLEFTATPPYQNSSGPKFAVPWHGKVDQSQARDRLGAATQSAMHDSTSVRSMHVFPGRPPECGQKNFARKLFENPTFPCCVCNRALITERFELLFQGT